MRGVHLEACPPHQAALLGTGIPALTAGPGYLKGTPPLTYWPDCKPHCSSQPDMPGSKSIGRTLAPPQAINPSGKEDIH